MERYHRVGYIKTWIMFLLFSLSILMIANGEAYASQYVLTCSSCHGMPPQDSSGDREIDTGKFKGNHQTHATADNCSICHNNNGYTISHRNKKIEFAFNINSSAAGSYSKGVFTNQTSIPSPGTCSSVNCHFNSQTLDWGSLATDMNCYSCHTAAELDGSHPTATPGASGKKHGDYYGTTLSSCTKCHPDHNSPASFSHATSVKNPARGLIVQFSTSPNSGGNYGPTSLLQYPNFLPDGSNRNGTCTNVYCHSDGKGGSIVNPTWGGTVSGCKGCHGAGSSFGEPDYSNEGANTNRSNSHRKHAAAGTTTCSYCHSTTTTTGTSIIIANGVHVDGAVTLAPGASKSFTTNNWASNKTCNNISCHGNGSAPAVWGATLDCKGCHGSDVASGAPITTGKHNAHINTAANATLGTALGCVECHAKTVSNNTTISAAANHTNSFVDYSGVKAGKSSTYSPSSGVCSAAYCHSDGKGTQRSMVADNWKTTTTLSCKGCHGTNGNSSFGEPDYSSTGANQLRSNSHNKHVKVYGSASCLYCHNSTATTGPAINPGTATHVDGIITLAQGGGKSFNAGAWTANKQCTNISCHNFNAATWGGSALYCNNCHTLSGAHLKHAGGLNLGAGGVSFYNYTANKSTGTGYYGFGCANCHPAGDPQISGLHMNGFTNVELTKAPSGATPGSLRALNGEGAEYVGGKCNNIYCHSDGYNAPGAGTVAWTDTFIGDRCAQCHGNSPVTGAHQSHVVGIHYDDIFNGVSGKLAAGSTGNVSHGIASQGTVINCDICHNKTINTSGNDLNTVCGSCHKAGGAALKGIASVTDISYHVNGKADISFKSVQVVSKAQMRSESFNNYTAIWQRNGSYKNGAAAYDTAKQALNDTMWEAGTKGQGRCSNIACHVGYSVKWNDPLTCESCHARL